MEAYTEIAFYRDLRHCIVLVYFGDMVRHWLLPYNGLGLAHKNDAGRA